MVKGWDAMTDARIIHGDVVRFCQLHKALGLPQYHALLCDAPYELGGRVSIDDALNVSKVGGKSGFMQSSWDDTGIAFDPETWRAIADTLLPGAYMFVFAGNLNDDLISVAMRRAGLVKQHKSLAWAQGSSLPKTTRVDSQVDAAAGVEQEIVERKRIDGKGTGIQGGSLFDSDLRFKTIPATPLAQTWAGHRYGAQALRNLVEAILIFRKPYEGKAYESIVRTGAGSLNIAGSRIAHNEESRLLKKQDSGSSIYDQGEGRVGRRRDTLELQPGGRHPANFLLQHSPECIPRGTKRVRNNSGSVSGDEPSLPTEGVTYGKYNERLQFDRYADADGTEEVAAWECARDDSGAYLCPVALLDEQAGETANMHGAGHAREAIRKCKPSGNLWKLAGDGQRYGDTGGPSRFSFNADWQHEAFEQTARRIPDDTGHAIEDANAVRYQSKPSRTERDAGLDGGRGKSSIFGSIKVRECNVCGTRANGAGRGGTWPECGHEDWKYIEKKSEELEQLKGDSGVRAGNSHPT